MGMLHDLTALRFCQANHAPCRWVLFVLQFKEYLERAEYVKSLLDGQQPAEPAVNGATGQKMKPGGGGDKDVSNALPFVSFLVQGTLQSICCATHCDFWSLLAHPQCCVRQPKSYSCKA